MRLLEISQIVFHTVDGPIEWILPIASTCHHVPFESNRSWESSTHRLDVLPDSRSLGIQSVISVEKVNH